MNIKITADSTCDLSLEIIERYNIDILPLYVVEDEKSLRDGIDVSPEDIFDFVEKTGGSVSTSAVNTNDYINYFTKIKKNCDAIIHINISSEFSSCYQNALLAAETVEGVYPVDSRNLSTGSGHIVVEAAKMAENGASPEEIVSALKELTEKVEASFFIEKLDYLRRGGRCSALTALGANLLSLHPCIEVKDGKMGVGKKYRGNMTKVAEQYVKDRLEGRTDIQTDLIFVTHSPSDKDLVEFVKAEIPKYMKFDEIIETSAGCTVSSHCGPNTIGILFKRK
ncbi:MAG: DegV family protein [Oscillospiraceae bacterium]|nr:DegV family protein [Oscillospiraceae bacterium]